jgi:hypothetical protein
MISQEGIELFTERYDVIRFQFNYVAAIAVYF